MNLLVLRANPRKNGYTQYCTDLLVRGMREAGGAITDIDLTGLDIRPCIGCYDCWTRTPGTCIFSDDMAGVIEKIIAADMVVCATPLNSYSVSSWCKILFDRLFSITMCQFEEGNNGLIRNRIRPGIPWKKRLAAIIVGAFNGLEHFSGAKKTIELYTEGMSFFSAGIITRPESHLLQFALAKPKTVKIIENAFVAAGRELVADSAISAGTIEKCQTPLSSDSDYFKRYSNIYWEHATTPGADSRDLPRIRAAVESDVRVLMQEMARSIDPVATAKLSAVFLFVFPDVGRQYRLAVDHGVCVMSEVEEGAFDLRVTSSSKTWAALFTKKMSARDALVRRDIVLDGDKFLFSRLDRYFPPPVM